MLVPAVVLGGPDHGVVVQVEPGAAYLWREFREHESACESPWGQVPDTLTGTVRRSTMLMEQTAWHRTWWEWWIVDCDEDVVRQYIALLHLMYCLWPLDPADPPPVGVEVRLERVDGWGR